MSKIEKFMKIQKYLDDHNMRNCVVKDDVVDVNGDLRINNQFLKRLPFKFGTIHGSFKFLFNPNLDLIEELLPDIIEGDILLSATEKARNILMKIMNGEHRVKVYGNVYMYRGPFKCSIEQLVKTENGFESKLWNHMELGKTSKIAYWSSNSETNCILY